MAKKKVIKKEVTEEVVDKKALKAKKKKEAEKKMEGLWAEFKKFILRGNVVDMSIGVIIGGAFGAIVTAMTNILLNVCTWGVPGGLKSIITVLPPMNPAQEGLVALGLGQTISLANYYEIIATSTIPNIKDLINSQYTLHGSLYIYNGAAYIDWGTFINAVLSFLVIGLTLFVILKIFAKLQKTRATMRAKALEEYYKKHPEARPAPVAPGIPEPTDHQLLKEILGELRAQNNTKKTKKK
ncbi:MAG: MscL family protein [Bacilli bacterium]|nr:MscL family protein [Bacilli bacterium]